MVHGYIQLGTGLNGEPKKQQVRPQYNLANQLSPKSVLCFEGFKFLGILGSPLGLFTVKKLDQIGNMVYCFLLQPQVHKF